MANLQTPDGNQTTSAQPCGAGRVTSQGRHRNPSGSITMTGFAPSTPFARGNVLTGARLKVTHRSDGQRKTSHHLHPNLGHGDEHVHAADEDQTSGTEDVDLSLTNRLGSLPEIRSR